MSYTTNQTAELLKQGKHVLHKDTTDPKKLSTLSLILRLAFPLKLDKHLYDGLNYFHGVNGSYWSANETNKSGLPIIKLSEVVDQTFTIDEYTIKSTQINFIPKY